jgi:hypothetical protein
MHVTTEKKFGEYAVAATAFVVSVCSLFIYIYQSKLMAEQQQVAVWPHVQWASSNIDGYQLMAFNKGVGPALVRKVAISFNGKQVTSNRELIDTVMDGEGTVSVQNSVLRDAVMSPGEKIPFLIIPDKSEGKAFETRMRAGKLVIDITYCSIYGRCWISSGFAVKRTADDKTIDY